MTPAERSLRARIAAHTLHAKRDPKELTKAGRERFLSRFDVLVDPDGVLDPAERERRAKHARSAHFCRLALASSRERSTNTKTAEAPGRPPAVGGEDVHDNAQLA